MPPDRAGTGHKATVDDTYYYWTGYAVDWQALLFMQNTAEEIARALYLAAGLDPDVPARPIELARRLWGDDAVRVIPSREWRHPGPAVAIPWRGKPQIHLSSRSGERLREFNCGHELGELEGLRLGLTGEETEQLADRVAGAIIAPREAFLAALRSGLGLPGLAKTFFATRSMLALRTGEVTGRGTALVTPTSVRTRGRPAGGWPAESYLRQDDPEGWEKIDIQEGPQRRGLRSL